MNDTMLGMDYTRVTMRRLCRNLFRITLEGREIEEDYKFGFKARHLVGDYWWVNLKSFGEHVKRLEGTHFDRIELEALDK